MISQTARYALRTLGVLADRPGEWVLGKDMASQTGIPANYLSKILNQLRKRGLVQSQKGWGGGFLLQGHTLSVPISEVVELFDGPRETGQCVFELQPCDASHPCPLHQRWERVRHEYQSMLSTLTIGDLGRQNQP
ncbi:MAG: Rrf2 family transcriptional regulator [Thermoanaerobaculaceae bacterium]|nr:Rrf2 family transcriptional regulator [Thermoanaerobaculaceae bacterium]